MNQYHIAAGRRQPSTAVRSGVSPRIEQVLAVDPDRGEYKPQLRASFHREGHGHRHPINGSQLIHPMKTESFFMDNADYP
jgi:hypothetical protein